MKLTKLLETKLSPKELEKELLEPEPEYVPQTEGEELLLSAKKEIEEFTGEPFPLSHIDPDGAVALARAANYMAKTTDNYTAKVKAFAGAAMLKGVESGWGDDGCFYISGPLGQEASAHDPYGDLYNLLSELDQTIANQQWPKPWSGKIRQPYAFEIAKGIPKRRERAIKKSLK